MTEGPNGGASDQVRQSAGSNRAMWRRESALLIVLALVGVALEFPFALALKFVTRAEVSSTFPVLAIAIVLTAMVPFAVRVNSRLALPGAPLLAAKLAGERLHFRVSSLLRISVSYAILAALVGAVVLSIVIVPIFLMHPNSVGRVNLPVPPMMKLAPGRIAIVGALVAIPAAVSEEIQFRLVLFAVFAWIARAITRGASGASGRGALWFATILQAYAFGMVHLVPLAGSMFHTTGKLLVGGLLMPQTWEGVVFGRLYLRRGLEAAMLAHATMDFALFVLVAIARSRLGAR